MVTLWPCGVQIVQHLPAEICKHRSWGPWKDTCPGSFATWEYILRGQTCSCSMFEMIQMFQMWGKRNCALNVRNVQFSSIFLWLGTPTSNCINITRGTRVGAHCVLLSSPLRSYGPRYALHLSTVVASLGDSKSFWCPNSGLLYSIIDWFEAKQMQHTFCRVPIQNQSVNIGFFRQQTLRTNTCVFVACIHATERIQYLRHLGKLQKLDLWACYSASICHCI